MKRPAAYILLILSAVIQTSCEELYSGLMDNNKSNYTMDIFYPNNSATGGCVISFSESAGLYQDYTFSTNNTTAGGGLADLNDDGSLDLISISQSAADTIINFTDDNGQPLYVLDFSGETSNAYVNDGVISDFTNDGKPDIYVCGNYTSSGLNELYINKCYGINTAFSIDTSSTFPASINFVDVCAGDFDGDGDNDIFLTDDNLTSYVYLNNGKGLFSAGETYTSSDQHPNVCTVVCDIDNDSDQDIIQAVSDSSSNGYNVYKNRGDGTFTSEVISGFGFYSIAAGDIDSDGDIDIYAGSDDGLGNIFLINNGQGTFYTADHTYAYSYGPTISALFADVDLDGDLDLVTNQGSTVYFYENDGTNNFPVKASFAAGYASYGMCIGHIIK